MATQEMWRMVSELLEGEKLPASLSTALNELSDGTSAVEPVDKVAIDLKMLEAGVRAFKAHGDDIGATVVDIYKAMRSARTGAASGQVPSVGNT